jgi:acetyl-CoA carboxylase carboxyltransferase component
MRNSKDEFEKDWRATVEELHLRQSLANQMGGPKNLARHQAAGRLNVRERIDKLLDKDSFHETGASPGSQLMREIAWSSYFL